MEVKIGIQSTPRELVVDTETAAEDVERALTAALADGGVFSLPDEKGGKILIPADKIAYLELGSSEPRRVGFGNPDRRGASTGLIRRIDPERSSAGRASVSLANIPADLAERSRRPRSCADPLPGCPGGLALSACPAPSAGTPSGADRGRNQQAGERQALRGDPLGLAERPPRPACAPTGPGGPRPSGRRRSPRGRARPRTARARCRPAPRAPAPAAPVPAPRPPRGRSLRRYRRPRRP